MTTRIAIDCRPLVGPRAGIGRYLYEVLNQFALRSDDVEYLLYAPGDIEIPESCKHDRRFQLKLLRLRPAELWLYTVVPVWMVKDRVDVFWGPNYSLPPISFSRGVRQVITVHDTVHARYPETMLWKTRLHNQLMLPVYCRMADLIVTDSHSARNELIEMFGIHPERIHTVHLGTSLSPVEDNSTRLIESDYILSVGTIEPRKNFARLVEAYSNLEIDMKRKYKLVIAGGQGWGGENPQSWFAHYGVEEHATYLGRVSDDDLRNLYTFASLFVFPSLYEGFGLPILEAMNMGVPVLGAKTSSIPEILVREELLFDPMSPTDLYNKMESLLCDVRRLQRMRLQSLLLAEKFSWEATAAQTLALLIG